MPVRGDVAVFAAMEKATVPVPLPLAPEVMVSQGSLLVAVQLQPAAVVTVLLPEVAAAPGVSDVGETVKVHGGGAPDWVTVTVWPAMVSVPVRGEVAVFASIEKATVPLPLPVTPDVMVIQEALLVAVQLQPVAVVTVLLLELAPAPGVSDAGETAKLQGDGAPAWVTVTVCPAMVSVPVRGDVAVLAAIENATAPFPLPLAPDVMVSHAALLVAAQLQPASVVTVLLLELAAAPGLSDVGKTVNVHGTPAWVTVTVWPAMVSVPVRGDVAVLAAIEKATVPLPVPPAPEVMVSQELLLVAVHEQLLVVETVALVEPAAAVGLSEVGDTVNEQGRDPAA